MLVNCKRRIVSILLAVFMLCTMPGITVLADSVTGETTESSSLDFSNVTTFSFDGNTVTVTEGDSDNYEVVVYDDTDAETAPDTSVDDDGNTVYSVPDGSSGELRVSIKKKGGEYVFYGSGYGSIAVKKEAAKDAVLYLDGLTLESAFTAVITVGKNSSAACTIYVVDGTESTLTDNAYNNDDTYTANAAAENAVIKCKDASDVTITGSGTLNVIGNGKNGIKANNLLTIENVTLVIDALDNGISCENSLVINSGAITISTDEGDGIKSCADAEAVGSIAISGGTFTIDAYADAIQAMAELTITGGDFSITTFGGYDAAYDGDDDSYPSAKGLKCSGSYTDTDGNEVDAADCELVISGGTFVLNTADDAIHSDCNLTITGGEFTIQTGDDAIHADYVTTLGISDGSDEDVKITVNNCYEGIEGATVNLYSGTYVIYSSDDSINAANSDLTGYTYEMNIYGGSIYAAANTNDCLDSNGNITISGGTIVALGALDNTTEINAALDCDGVLTVTGGTILAVGMQEMISLPGTRSQAYAAWTDAGSSTAVNGGSGNTGSFGMGMQSGGSGFVSNGDVLTVADADGNTLFTATAAWNSTSSSSVNYVLYTDETIASGSSYTLLVNGSSESTGSGTQSDAQPGGSQSGTQPGDPQSGTQPGDSQSGTQPGGSQSGTQPDSGQDTHVHSYTLSTTVEATCTTAGYQEYTCSCGSTYRVAIAATGHSYTTTVTAATCTTAGYTTYTCSSCGNSYKANYTTATGHSWNSGVVTKAATCDTTGIMTYTCTSCGATYTSVIAATGLSTPVITSVKNTTSGLKITWGKVDEASGYYIYRSTSKSGTYTRIASVSSGSTVTYTNQSSGTYKVVSGKTYYYKVVAYHGNTTSSRSSAKGKRYLTYGKITSLKNLTSGITLKWNKVSGASGYYIYRKASTASSYTLVKKITTASTVSYTDTKVKSKNGTVYTYKVVPYYENSSGIVTKASCKTKKIVRLTTTSLSSVKNSSSKKVTVKWKKNAKASGYQIQYSTSSSFSSSKKVTVTKAATVSKTIGSLTKGKTYYVRVRSYKTVSGTKYYSAWSAKKSVKVTA